MFVFEHEELEMNLRLKFVEKKKGEYAVCVLSECQAWRNEIAFREARRQRPEMR